jgi:hypothetical protein
VVILYIKVTTRVHFNQCFNYSQLILSVITYTIYDLLCITSFRKRQIQESYPVSVADLATLKGEDTGKRCNHD